MAKTTVSICPECRAVVRVGFTVRNLDNNVDEIGIECPKCKYWQSSYFLNQELKDMQIENAGRKERRVYTHKFKKFQRVMKKKVAA